MHLGGEYKRRAARCLLIATQTDDPSRKYSMTELARLWTRLADQAIKNSQTDVYLFPPAATRTEE